MASINTEMNMQKAVIAESKPRERAGRYGTARAVSIAVCFLLT